MRIQMKNNREFPRKEIRGFVCLKLYSTRTCYGVFLFYVFSKTMRKLNKTLFFIVLGEANSV